MLTMGDSSFQRFEMLLIFIILSDLIDLDTVWSVYLWRHTVQGNEEIMWTSFCIT